MIRRSRPRAAFLLAILLVLVLPGPSAAVYPVTDAAHIQTSIWAELARYLQAALDYYAQIQQVVTQYSQLEAQYEALRKLEFHSWRDLGPLLSQVQRLHQQTEGLVYTGRDLQSKFKRLFPGDESYGDLPEEVRKQSVQTLATIQVALEVAGKIHEDTTDNLAGLRVVKAQVERARGHEQTLEAISSAILWTAEQSVGAQLQAAAVGNAQLVELAYRTNRDAQLNEAGIEIAARTRADAWRSYSRAHRRHSVLPEWSR
jgi:P-type conjugative transfer protein TrbJ